MPMRRLWEYLTRRLCAFVWSCESSGYDTGNVDPGTQPRPEAFLARPREGDGDADRDWFSSSATHEDALLRVVVDTFPLDNVTWQSYYLSVAGVGLAFLLAHRLHVQPVSGLDTVLPIIALMALLAVGGLYQLYTRVVFFAPPP